MKKHKNDTRIRPKRAQQVWLKNNGSGHAAAKKKEKGAVPFKLQ